MIGRHKRAQCVCVCGSQYSIGVCTKPPREDVWPLYSLYTRNIVKKAALVRAHNARRASTFTKRRTCRAVSRIEQSACKLRVQNDSEDRPDPIDARVLLVRRVVFVEHVRARETVRLP